MDDIVRQAMAKWPNVPHCYGWLGLDARGAWRMRDERAQQLGLSGDKLAHEALIGFINRNYARDERGCWYFQNGPQRVYLNLEATPFVARTDPAAGLVLQTGEALTAVDEAFMTSAGTVIVRSGDKAAQVDDRDMASVTEWMLHDGVAVSDETLMAWMEAPDGKLALRYGGQVVPVQPITDAEIETRLGFNRTPAP
ncbi:MAG TPA: DUF2946 family protein [Telluria sp.]|nr:DUF2946 family protein [Telluria sp.]